MPKAGGVRSPKGAIFSYQLSAGLRYLATGLIIIAVITAAGSQNNRR